MCKHVSDICPCVHVSCISGLVTPEAVAGRFGGRVLRTIGISGKNAERCVRSVRFVHAAVEGCVFVDPLPDIFRV